MNGLEKLKITAFSKNTYAKSTKTGEFTVLINPESIKRDVEIQYSDEEVINSSGVELRFNKIQSEKLSFKLVLDGTGLISTAPTSLKEGDKIKPVDEQISMLKKVVLAYSGKIHRPRFLQLTWGTTLFKGVLTSLNITYKLFSPSGAALRAEVDLGFSSSISTLLRKKQENNKSPDITHIELIKAGDRLPAICNDIYEGPNYFVQVAKANNLDTIRGIPTGTQLSFPPLLDK